MNTLNLAHSYSAMQLGQTQLQPTNVKFSGQFIKTEDQVANDLEAILLEFGNTTKEQSENIDKLRLLFTHMDREEQPWLAQIAGDALIYQLERTKGDTVLEVAKIKQAMGRISESNNAFDTHNQVLGYTRLNKGGVKLPSIGNEDFMRLFYISMAMKYHA